MSEDLVWRVALLTVVFVTDIVVFVGLCREELRDWRAGRNAARTARASGRRLAAIAVHSSVGAHS
ncbi:MAG TPA: hypothetical protein VE397_09290 [Stellaceae bacterium]|nr:hypothetical protein [Stellaceae bacterium]